MCSEKEFIYVTDREWAINAFLKNRKNLSGIWYLITNPEDLVALLQKITPRYIFFPHWSCIVPSDIVRNFECVCFHMTDLPYGRGGSPLQNLIIRGHCETKLSALRMNEALDSGPIYTKETFSLRGTAETIFSRMSDLALKQMMYIIKNEPEPESQPEGCFEKFKRRRDSDSEITEIMSLSQLHDFIRMLDAPGYRKAFIKHEDYVIYFTNSILNDDLLNATVEIKINSDPSR
jgi:methionyl-tRNA formyltransferase